MLARFTVPTITVRNVSPKVVQSLKALARRHNRSMEQEVRDVLEGYVADRRAVMEQIEAGWAQQARRPTAAEIDGWMAIGRP
jgi:plasmid stability protein